MQPYIGNTLGFKPTIQVPSSVEEFDRLAKRDGACLEEGNKNVIYRSIYAQARNGFLHGVDEEKDASGAVVVPAIEGLDKRTGTERKYKVVKPEVRDGDKITQEEVTAWDEKEDAYAERVFATLVQQGEFPSVEAARAAFAPLMQQVVDTIPFDPSRSERASAGPKKTPKTYYGIADALVEIAGSIEAAAQKFTAKTGRAVSADRDALAKAIWEDQTAQRKNIAAGYAG